MDLNLLESSATGGQSGLCGINIGFAFATCQSPHKNPVHPDNLVNPVKLFLRDYRITDDLRDSTFAPWPEDLVK